MSNTISPNMNLIIPGVGSESGPTYAFDVNSSLTLIDSHDHSFGKGVQITPAGININATFPMNDNVVSQIQALTFQAQSSASTLPQGLSVAPGGESPPQQDLWYTPDTGIPIQITENGIVKTTASSIPGESYSAGTFFWTQTQDSLPTNPANFDIGSITLRPNLAATSFGITIIPPTTATYDLNLPNALPASRKIMTLDNSGNIGDVLDVDGTSIIIVGNSIELGPTPNITHTQISPTAGILQSQLAFAALQQSSRTFVTGTTSFTVPTGVNFLIAVGCGGGGGGGSGGSSAGASGFAGGAGGAGSTPTIMTLPVTPGDVLTVVVGAGGAGGTIVGAGSGGITGTAGSNTTVTGASSGQIVLMPGGAGGQGTNGGGGVTATVNTVTWSIPLFATTVTTGGGGGAGTGGGGTSGAGTGGGLNNRTNTPAATGGAGNNAGGGAGAGGGGGGGGAGFGAGGNGGQGAAGGNGVTGGTTSNFGAGGGGGGGGSTIAGSTGGAGGHGGAGTLVLYWQTGGS